MKRIGAVLLLVALLVVLTGCVSGTDAEKLAYFKQNVAQLQQDVATSREVLATVEAQKAALDVVIEALPEGSPERAKAETLRAQAETTIGKLKTFLATANDALAKLNTELEGATDWVGAAEATAKTGVGFAPSPWNIVGGAVLGLVFGLIRAYRTKQNAKKVVESVQPLVDAALASNPQLAETLDRQQGYGGKALVDAVQGAKPSLPF